MTNTPFRSFGYRVAALFLAAVFVFTALPLASYAADYKYPAAYWKVHQPYIDAVTRKDKPEILRLGKIIIDLLKNDPYGDTILNLYNKYSDMADIYQEMEDYDNALYYTREKLRGAEYIDAVLKTDMRNAIKLTREKLRSLDLQLQVYAESADVSKVPYFGAKAEPKSGVYLGRVYGGDELYPPTQEESILSFYVLFGKEKLWDFDWFIREYDQTDRVLHFAWNLYEENDGLSTVLNSSSDEHIISTLKYLNTFKSPVMLRIFAEMNVWSRLADPAQFKKAYIKIAELARKYAPNTALVFSPNNISEWSRDIDEYYPGDKYVDWVGVSLYASQYSDVNNPIARGDYNEAYYYNGIYANPIVQLGDIVARYGDRKPILISEGGAGHKIKKSGKDMTAFSKKYIDQVYGYLGMVYPSVKAAIYFDLDLPISAVNYKLSDNKTVADAYFSALKSNPALNQGLAPSGKTYVKLNSFSGKTNMLNLATYAVIPSNNTTQVEYLLDGVSEGKTSQVPYRMSIDVASLTYGSHKLETVVRDGKYTKKLTSYIIKGEDGVVKCASNPPSSSVKASPVNASVQINGKKVSFEVFNINGSNYFNLRDIASAISGTPKQFNLNFDGAKNTWALTSGTAYKSVGGELSNRGGGSRTVQPLACRVTLGGKGCPLAGYAIHGAPYVKLKDAGDALGFKVSWDFKLNITVVDSK